MSFLRFPAVSEISEKGQTGLISRYSQFGNDSNPVSVNWRCTPTSSVVSESVNLFAVCSLSSADGEAETVEFDSVEGFFNDGNAEKMENAGPRKLTVIRSTDSKKTAQRGRKLRPVSWPNSLKNSSSRPSVKNSKYIRRRTAVDGDLESILSSIQPNATPLHCNSILKYLEQSRDEEDTLFFFDWMKRNKKLDQNSFAYNLALRALSRMEDWNSSEQLLDQMVSDSNCKLNFQVFNTLIYVCHKRGLPKQGSKWFRMMLDRGIQPNVATYSMLMSLYQKTGFLDDAEFTFAQMRQSNQDLCITAYSAMITLYTRQGLHGKSEEIIGFMRDDKMCPNEENWLVQLNAYCQQGELEKAEAVFKAMRENGFSGNIVAYNTLITGYGKVADTDAVECLFQKILSDGLDPDETTYRSMVESYGRADDKEQAMLYYAQLKHSGFRPNSANFYTMINLQARHGDETEIGAIIQDMRTVGCEYSSILTLLLHAYERIGKVDRVVPIMEAEGSLFENVLFNPTSCSILVLSCVKNYAIDDAIMVLKKIKWKDSDFLDNLYHTLICYCKEVCNYDAAILIFQQMFPKALNLHITSSMIDIYSRVNRFRDAEDLYLALKCSGTKLDMIAFSIVVRMYVKSGRLKEACLVVDLINKQNDIVPDTYLYRDMLRIYQQCGVVDGLADVYYKMLKSNLEWDEAMYNCVINCCGHALPIDEISKVFEEMSQCGYICSNLTLNVMLDVYGKSGFLKKAERVLQMGRKHGLTDIISYNTLISAYGQHMDFGGMQSVIQRMQNAGHEVSLEAYNCLLDAYGKDDQLDEFNEILEKIKQLRCRSDHYTYNIMINIYGKKGWIEDVGNVLAELRRHGLEPDLYSYNSLIKAYGIAGMVEEAVGLVKELREKGLHPDRVTYVNLISALQRNEKYLEAVKWSLWMKQIQVSS